MTLEIAFDQVLIGLILALIAIAVLYVKVPGIRKELTGAAIALGLALLVKIGMKKKEPEEVDDDPTPPALPPDTVERIKDERETPKPPPVDPVNFPDDNPDAVEQLGKWGDELLDKG